MHIANGKKIVTFDPHRQRKEDFLPLLMGRSGNLRAPAVLIGDELFVGFSEELYRQIAGK